MRQGFYVTEVVKVYEAETNASTLAIVTDVEDAKGLVFLSLDWNTLAIPTPDDAG